MVQPKVQLSLEQALVLLSGGPAGVSEWNEYFAGGQARADLGPAELGDADLRGARLRGVQLGAAELRGTDLFQADLRDSDLSEADLSDAHLSEANLGGACLTRAGLERANLVGADLSGAKVSGANLCQAELVGANLNDADFSRATLVAANLLGASLRGTKLASADLSLANLSGADLEGADLNGANLEGANLCRTNLSRATLESACLNNADLERAVWQGAQLSQASFDPDVDLMLLEWDSLTIEGVDYARDAVERSGQLLPGGTAPLRIVFEVQGEVTQQDLDALKQLLKSQELLRGTHVYVSLSEDGSALVVEGRGKLPRAALLGALLYALPNAPPATGALGQGRALTEDGAASESSALRASLLAASPELLACAKKLSQVYVRPRADSELEHFRTLIDQYGADADTRISSRVVTLVQRSPATERLMLDGLGLAAVALPPRRAFG